MRKTKNKPFCKNGEYALISDFPPALRAVGLGVESWKPEPFPEGAKGKRIYDRWVKRVLHLLRRNPLCQCANPACAVIFAKNWMFVSETRDKYLCEECRITWKKRAFAEGARTRERIEKVTVAASVWEECGDRPKDRVGAKMHSKKVADKMNSVLREKYKCRYQPITGKWVTWHVGWIEKALTDQRKKGIQYRAGVGLTESDVQRLIV